jgi:predicted tellurium resistance membrane protein TerC
MIALLTSPEAWAALLTLTALEIVLGIDNVIFLSVIVSRIPQAQARRARQIGLALALVFRILLLSLLVWLIGLTQDILTVKGIALHHSDRRRAVSDREGDPRNSRRGGGGRGGER